MVEVLRQYAQTDPDAGYTQGMCFAAAVVCVHSHSLSHATEEFHKLARSLRDLWIPGFPLVMQGVPLLERLLQDHDPELASHLQSVLPDLRAVVAGAWLSVFAKWLPLSTLFE